MIDEDLPSWLLVLGVAIVAIPLLMMSMMMLMMGAMGGPPMMGPGGGPGGGPGVFRFVGVVPLAIALIVGYGGYRALQAETERTEKSAVERLREQYVAGEISEEEFERKLERRIDATDADVDAMATNRQPEFER